MAKEKEMGQITCFQEYIVCLRERTEYHRVIYSLRAGSPILPEIQGKVARLEEIIIRYEVTSLRHEN
jgi:hypothetical protein